MVAAQRQRMGHAAMLGEVERVVETTQQLKGSSPEEGSL